MSDFRFYQPNWLEYEETATRIRSLFVKAVGSKLQDITGIVSQDGWEPDWPVILRFESISVSFNTKCCYLWSIDTWREDDGLREDVNEYGPLILSEKSLVQLLGLPGLVGTTLRVVYWPVVRSDGGEQSFVLAFSGNTLRVYDAGDQLGLQVLDPDQARLLSTDWMRILDLEKK